MLLWPSQATTHHTVTGWPGYTFSVVMWDVVLVFHCIRVQGTARRFRLSWTEGMNRKLQLLILNTRPMGSHRLSGRLRLMSQRNKWQQVLFLHQGQTKHFRSGTSKLFKRTYWNYGLQVRNFRTFCPTEKLISVQFTSWVQVEIDFKHLNKTEQKFLFSME